MNYRKNAEQTATKIPNETPQKNGLNCHKKHELAMQFAGMYIFAIEKVYYMSAAIYFTVPSRSGNYYFLTCPVHVLNNFSLFQYLYCKV